jgi:hypothetical protein
VLRLSWIHDAFDLAAVCRDAVYSFGGGIPPAELSASCDLRS